MELYIVRHGQTSWNAAGRLQGTVDIELNSVGREAAIALGEKLEREGVVFDCIYTSPLLRAYETAALIRGRQNIPIIRDDRLREISFGDSEGEEAKNWLHEDSPYRHFFDAPEKYQPPKNGESLESVIARTGEFLEEVLRPLAKDNKRVLIVAHGALNKGLMCHLEGNTVATYWGKGLQKNCEADVFHI